VIHFGPSGLGPNPVDELTRLSNLGLKACEAAFTYGVRMKKEIAEDILELNKSLKMRLSVHAPYYINLASKDKEKAGASRTRILQSCERGEQMGAEYVVFHAGFFQDQDREIVAQKIAEQILKIKDIIWENGWKIRLAPELTGKASQFGSIEELMYLVDKTKCYFCIDFAHEYARNAGKIDYPGLFSKLKGFSHLHCHFSGIEFGPKGEKRHLVLEKKIFMPLATELLKWEKSGDDERRSATIISESPITWEDSVKMKNWYEETRPKT
jgi:deoxyribonuclease-4